MRLETSNSANKSNGTVQTKGGALRAGEWAHLALTVGADRSTKIFVNGVERASGKIGDADLTNSGARLVVGGIENVKHCNFHGEITEAQVFSKTLSSVDVAQLFAPGKALVGDPALAPAVRRFGEKRPGAPPTPPFSNGKFALSEDEVVVFMGQTDMVRMRLDGTLETALVQQFAKQKPRFRNMAWESDTVYEQWRDIDFGSWEDQLRGVGATVILAQFGQMEALQGEERIPQFIAAYEKLLDQIATLTHQVVLISPRPFEQPLSSFMPDHRRMNEVVAKYSEAIRQLAQRRQAIFVDLFKPSSGSPRLTSNGLHCSERGLAMVARRILKGLGVKVAGPAQLKAAILEKNRLWFDNWRPMNWSFAFGDRTNQQFSRANGNRPPLKVELQDFRPILQEADKRVHELALGRPYQAAPPKMTQPAPPPPGDHSPEAQLASFRVREGFEINLFASEADGVVKPVQMRWDDRGRLWVICTPTYPHIEPGLHPGDYILICEDTDDDGKADKFDRFAEGLFIPMGLEFGDGGLYVTEATELVHLKDADGDGKADSRTVILSGFGTADSHQMVNGLERGPLGDFWFAQGHHAYSRVETPWGISKLEKAGVWRYRPKTGRLDGFFNKSTAGLNCQGVTHDDWGQTFHNSAALSGGFYTSAGAIATEHTKRLGPVTPNPSRNTGIEFIGTRHLPEEMQGQIVWGGFMSNTIELRKLHDDGAGFKADKLPDLIQSNRREFRPVNVKVGPDGAIYLCDWYNATIGHYQASYRDPARDRAHGRIWRVTAKGRPLVKPPKLDGLSPTQLLELLRSPERLTRSNAKKRLFDLPTEKVIPAAKAWFGSLDKTTPEYAHLVLELSGVFAAHEEVWPKLVSTMTTMEDPRVRAIGVRLVGRWSDRLVNALQILELTANDKHPRVRMETVVACTLVKSATSMQIAATVLDHPQDRFIDYAFGRAVHALRPLWLPALERGEISFAENSHHLKEILEEAASGQALNLVRQLAEGGEPGSLSLLVQFGTPDDLTKALQVGGNSPLVLESLLEASRVHKKKPRGELGAALSKILKKNDPSSRPLAIALIGAWEVKSLTSTVRASLASPDSSESTRVAAIRSFAELEGSKSLPVLEEFATVEQSQAVRTAAIRAITRVNGERAAALVYALLPALTNTEQMSPLVAALVQGSGRGSKLAELITKKPLRKDVLTKLHQALGLTGQSCPPLEKAIREAQNLPSQPPAKYDAQYVARLKRKVETSGNFDRGKHAYLKAATCVGCHKVEGVGGDIGPDLTEVGSGRSIELLIESVLWPNRQIREGYMTTKITTKDDRLHVGYRLSEEGGVVRVRDIATADVTKIARANIKKEEEAGSSMVAGLTAGLSEAELADLVSYLAGLKKK